MNIYKEREVYMKRERQRKKELKYIQENAKF